MTDNKYKKWFIRTLLSMVVVLLLIVGAMVYVDPYFHYHGPIDGISYRLYARRSFFPKAAS